ncbi:MAG: DNA alkylation repair protein [Fimbriimonadaceae bacterium]|nr:DNA alkylation repair protein [Chthonomonadaceae bacterium]MCO5297242.1 DNA alkylation repair protein [Fimbriimonadaceae bacterium]
MEAVVEQVRMDLLEVSKPGRAEFEKRYLKSSLEFIGAPVPEQAKLAKALWRAIKGCSRQEMWGLVEAMWKTRVHEIRGVALDLLALAPALVTKRDLPLLRRWVIESNGWAHVDTIATSILPAVIAADPSALTVMDRWALDANFWVRRAAMLSLLLPLRRGDLGQWERFVAYASPQLGEKEFFIRKAIGWVLRETGKRQPQVVFEFLMEHRSAVSGLTLREGAKYLPPAMRADLGLP